MNTHDIGDVVAIRAIFTQAGVAVDPGTVILRVKAPNGTITNYDYAVAEITRDSAGNYSKSISIAASGMYRYRWTSTGAGAASQESAFEIRPRRVA